MTKTPTKRKRPLTLAPGDLCFVPIPGSDDQRLVIRVEVDGAVNFRATMGKLVLAGRSRRGRHRVRRRCEPPRAARMTEVVTMGVGSEMHGSKTGYFRQDKAASHIGKVIGPTKEKPEPLA